MNADAIVKALKCCNVPSGRACSECPYHEIGAECRTQRNKDAVELILELTKENRNFKEEYDADTLCIDALQDVIKGRDETIEMLVEENERLQDLVKEVQQYNEAWVADNGKLRKEVKTIKTDTVQKIQKLFEERLDISVCGYSTEEVVSDVLEMLDRVVIEVLEENNV